MALTDLIVYGPLAKIEKVLYSIDQGGLMIAKTFILLTFLFAFILPTALAACRPIQNYEDPEDPLYAGAYAENSPDFDGEIKVITWN
ncbi:MAG: hypothetical protein GY869_18400, partial [Planctomycetes bacterium]|nr:hypothetical protein [Planctomycetota bacterium]